MDHFKVLEGASSSHVEYVEYSDEETVACEKMLGRLNSENDMTNEQWESFGKYISRENS